MPWLQELPGAGLRAVARHPVAVACTVGAIGLAAAAEAVPGFLVTAASPDDFGTMIGPVTFHGSFRLADISTQAPDVAGYHLVWAATLVALAVSSVAPGNRFLAAAAVGLGGGLGLILLSLYFGADRQGWHIVHDLAASPGGDADAWVTAEVTAHTGFYCAVAAVGLACAAVVLNSTRWNRARRPTPSTADDERMIEVTTA